MTEQEQKITELLLTKDPHDERIEIVHYPDCSVSFFKGGEEIFRIGPKATLYELYTEVAAFMNDIMKSHTDKAIEEVEKNEAMKKQYTEFALRAFEHFKHKIFTVTQLNKVFTNISEDQLLLHLEAMCLYKLVLHFPGTDKKDRFQIALSEYDYYVKKRFYAQNILQQALEMQTKLEKEISDLSAQILKLTPVI